MKAKAFLIASLFAMSLSLTACGGSTEETPAMDTTSTATEAPAAPVTDTTAAPATTPVDTTAASTTTPTDTAATADTTK